MADNPPDDDDDDDGTTKKKKMKKRKKVDTPPDDEVKKKKQKSFSKKELNSAMYELSGNRALAVEYLTTSNIATEVRIAKLCFSVTDDACVHRLAKFEKSGKMNSSTARQILQLLGPEKSAMWKERLEYLLAP